MKPTRVTGKNPDNGKPNRVPFISFSTEATSEQHADGATETVKLVVMKIDQDALKIYATVAAALVATIIGYFAYGAWN